MRRREEANGVSSYTTLLDSPLVVDLLVEQDLLEKRGCVGNVRGISYECEFQSISYLISHISSLISHISYLIHYPETAGNPTC